MDKSTYHRCTRGGCGGGGAVTWNTSVFTRANWQIKIWSWSVVKLLSPILLFPHVLSQSSSLHVSVWLHLQLWSLRLAAVQTCSFSFHFRPWRGETQKNKYLILCPLPTDQSVLLKNDITNHRRSRGALCVYRARITSMQRKAKPFGFPWQVLYERYRF